MVQYTIQNTVIDESGKPLESGIERKKIDINLSKIDAKYPNEVKVIGETPQNSNDYNYSYEPNSGFLQIECRQNNAFKIICTYNSYTNKKIERDLSFDINCTIKVNNLDNEVKAEGRYEKKVTEDIGTIVSTEYETSELYNGNIKLNIANGTSLDTDYTEKMSLIISQKDMVDTIDLTEENTFEKVGENDESDERIDLGNNGNLVYKSSRLYKDNIKNILGEEGNLGIYDEDDNLLFEINKETKYDENGIIEIKYENELSKIKIKTSDIENEGIIVVENVKSIKSNFKELKNIIIKTKTINGEEINENEIELKDTITRVDLSLDNKSWNNSGVNNVTFNAIFLTNNIKYSLLNNPILEIKMPKEVKDVKIENISVLYSDELKIVNQGIVEKDGNKYIKVEIEGSQKDRNNNLVVEGVNVIISTKITLNEKFETCNANIEYTYSNGEDITDYELDNKENKIIEIEEKETASKEKGINNSISVNRLKAGNLSGNVEINTQTFLGSTEINQTEQVYEGQILKYNVNITNGTDSDLTNLKVKVDEQNAVIYDLVEVEVYNPYISSEIKYMEHEYGKLETGEKEFDNIEKLASGETLSLTYQVCVDEVNEEKETYGLITVKADNLEEIEKETLRNKIKQAQVSLELKNEYKEELTLYDEGRVPTALIINNITDENVENAKVEIEFSDNLDLNTELAGYLKVLDKDLNEIGESVVNGIEFNENDNKLSFNINEIEKDGQIYIEVWTTGKCGNEEKEYEISKVKSNVTIGNNKYVSNTLDRKLYHIVKNIVVSQHIEEEKESYKTNDNLNYVIEVKNNDIGSVHVDIKDEFNNLFKINSVTMNNNDEETKIDGNNPIFLQNKVLNGGESIILKANVTIDGYVESDKVLSNNVIVNWDRKTTSNNLDILLKSIYAMESQNNQDDEDEENNYNNNNNQYNDNSNSQEGKSTKQISGIAWMDENKNGQIDDNEEKISDLKVSIADIETNQILDNVVYTDKNGKYSLKVPEGKYIVLFDFDNSNYDVTDYKKSGVSENVNSDAIKKRIRIDGKESVVAITDTLDIKNDISGINIGLIKKETFDLKLDKSISKVIVQNKAGTKQTDYNKTKLAKTELKAKQFVGSVIIVEYEIDIKNEGEGSGYVNDVVDYIPEGLEFKSEMNSNWYLGADGVLHNESLKDQRIEPNETKTLKLLLIRTINNDSGMTLVNSAEINDSISTNESYDIDSIAGNNKKGEDDISEASLIISVSTGREIVLVGAILVALVSTLVMIVIIKKKGVKKDEENIKEN